MKKIKNTLILLGVCLFSLSNAQKIQKEHFTTIDKLFYVELGMTANEVQTTLNVEPFDFYQNLAEGEMIIEYRYLHKRLEIRSKDNNYVKSKGEDYYSEPASIFCTFDKDKKLLSYYTDAGNANSEDAYIWENTIIEHNINPDCSTPCVIVSEENVEESSDDGSFNADKEDKEDKEDNTKKKRKFPF